MLHRFKGLGLALVTAGSISLLSLVPAAAQSAYPYGPAARYSTGSPSYVAPSPAKPRYGYGAAPSAGYGNASSAYGGQYAGRYYTVVRGDTLSGIALRFGVSLRALLAANPRIYNPGLIFPGQTLAIPAYGSGAYGATGSYGGYANVAPSGSSGAYQAPGTATAEADEYAAPAAPATGVPTPQPTPGAGATPSAVQQTVTLNLAAHNMAFDQSTLSVPARAHVIVHFNNMDAMPHSLAVYTDSSARQAIFQGQIVMGPNTATYEFEAPAQPGTYFFRCDVHPSLMTGQFTVQ